MLLGYGLAGWLLAAFQVSWLAWSITYALTIHLIRSGPAGIVLSSGWVMVLMTLAAVTQAWTPVWNNHLPCKQPHLWALGLLLIWAGATGLVVMSAFAPRLMSRVQGLRGKGAVYGIAAVAWMAMAIGGSTY